LLRRHGFRVVVLDYRVGMPLRGIVPGGFLGAVVLWNIVDLVDF
jgi:hypothetical protein